MVTLVYGFYIQSTFVNTETGPILDYVIVLTIASYRCAFGLVPFSSLAIFLLVYYCILKFKTPSQLRQHYMDAKIYSNIQKKYLLFQNK